MNKLIFIATIILISLPFGSAFAGESPASHSTGASGSNAAGSEASPQPEIPGSGQPEGTAREHGGDDAMEGKQKSSGSKGEMPSTPHQRQTTEDAPGS